MKKKYGVCAVAFAMGLAGLGAPAGRAQSRAAANEAGGGSEPSTVSTTSTSTTPAASSPADLDHRIEALEMELEELKTELAAKKTVEPAAAPAVTPGVSIGQDAAPAAAGAAPAAPEKTTIASLLGPTSLSGFVDTYYQTNFNHPDALQYGGADFRFSDFRDKSINLNMIELILDKAPDATAGAAGRTGYHFAAAYGDAMTAIDTAERAASPSGYDLPGFDQYVKEAYFSYLAPVGKGLQFDVGKFVTPMGAEVIESKDNWNYSRGLLFTYAIPLFHFGVRAKYTFNSKYNLTGFVLNGWNNVVDNNSGKTYGFSFNANPTKTFTYTINYLAGPEESNGSFGYTSDAANAAPVSVDGTWRQTWDAVAMWTPNAKWSIMGNFDYGRGDRVCIGCFSDDETFPPTLSSPVSWWGVAGYAKYAPDANDYFAARYEYFDDPDGYTASTSIPGDPYDSLPSRDFNAFGGLKNLHFNEITATYQRTIASYLLTRFEYRRDMADYPVYAMSNFIPGVKQQSTASISMIFLFDSRNAK